jgi:methionyl-tRNA formyltransferase
VHRAVIAGERETGVTIMRVVKALDAGAMMETVRRPIGPNETSQEVERDLASLGAQLLVAVTDALAEERATETPQDEAAATYAHRLTKDDGVVDWNWPADRIHNLIRGLHPWPHAFTFHNGHRLILIRSRIGGIGGPEGVAPQPTANATQVSSDDVPGAIVEAAGDRLVVATGDGLLQLLTVQPEGKRQLDVRAFLAGHKLAVGDLFGTNSKSQIPNS